jgi:hypothetical protein
MRSLQERLNFKSSNQGSTSGFRNYFVNFIYGMRKLLEDSQFLIEDYDVAVQYLFCSRPENKGKTMIVSKPLYEMP